MIVLWILLALLTSVVGWLAWETRQAHHALDRFTEASNLMARVMLTTDHPHLEEHC